MAVVFGKNLPQRLQKFLITRFSKDKDADSNNSEVKGFNGNELVMMEQGSDSASAKTPTINSLITAAPSEEDTEAKIADEKTEDETLGAETEEAAPKDAPEAASVASSSSEAPKTIGPKYAKSFLQNSMKFTNEIIDKYFVLVDEKNKKYSLKADSGYKNAYELNNALFQEYQNMLVLMNFTNGNVGNETANALKKSDDGKLLTLSNYMKYAESIDGVKPEGADEYKRAALKELIQKFSTGMFAFAQVRIVLEAIGVKNIKQTTRSGNYVFTFNFEGKSYEMTCNKKAAKSGLDNVRNDVSEDGSITFEGKKMIMKKAKAALQERDAEWGFKDWELTDEQIDELFNALPSLDAFTGSTEDFIKAIKSVLAVLYGQFRETGIIQSTQFGSVLDELGILDFVENMLNSGEFSLEVTKDEALKVIDKIVDKIKEEIRKKQGNDADVDRVVNLVLDRIFAEPSSFISQIIDYIGTMVDNTQPETYNLRDLLDRFLNDTDSFLGAMQLPVQLPDLSDLVNNLFDHDYVSFASSLLDFFPNNFSNVIPGVGPLTSMLKSLIESRSINGIKGQDAQDFIESVLSYISNHANAKVSDVITFILTMLNKFDSDGDGNWFDDIVNGIKSIINFFKNL